MHILTNRETKDVFRGRQGKAEPSCIMTDNLNEQKNKIRGAAVNKRSLNASAAFGNEDIQTAYLFVYQPQCILDVGVL